MPNTAIQDPMELLLKLIEQSSREGTPLVHQTGCPQKRAETYEHKRADGEMFRIVRCLDCTLHVAVPEVDLPR